MHYEEKIINGVLCYRNHPEGQFQELSQAEITSKYTDQKQKTDHVTNLLAKYVDHIENKGYSSCQQSSTDTFEADEVNDILSFKSFIV